MSSTKRKLSDFLSKVLITPSMRPGNSGICRLVADQGNRLWDLHLAHALSACSQTCSAVYPVLAPGERGRMHGYHDALVAAALWRGEYGRNRRKLLRDCIRWLRSQGL